MQPLYTIHVAGPSAAEEEGVWNMAVEQFVTCTVHVVCAVQYSVMYCQFEWRVSLKCEKGTEQEVS